MAQWPLEKNSGQHIRTAVTRFQFQFLLERHVGTLYGGIMGLNKVLPRFGGLCTTNYNPMNIVELEGFSELKGFGFLIN